MREWTLGTGPWRSLLPSATSITNSHIAKNATVLISVPLAVRAPFFLPRSPMPRVSTLSQTQTSRQEVDQAAIIKLHIANAILFQGVGNRQRAVVAVLALADVLLILFLVSNASTHVFV